MRSGHVLHLAYILLTKAEACDRVAMLCVVATSCNLANHDKDFFWNKDKGNADQCHVLYGPLWCAAKRHLASGGGLTPTLIRLLQTALWPESPIK